MDSTDARGTFDLRGVREASPIVTEVAVRKPYLMKDARFSVMNRKHNDTLFVPQELALSTFAFDVWTSRSARLPPGFHVELTLSDAAGSVQFHTLPVFALNAPVETGLLLVGDSITVSGRVVEGKYIETTQRVSNRPGVEVVRATLCFEPYTVIRGRASDEFYRPVADALVTLWRGRDESNLVIDQRTTTGPDGSFSIDFPREEGTVWRLRVTKRMAGKYCISERPLTVVDGCAGGARRGEIVGGAENTVALPPFECLDHAILRGRVADTSDRGIRSFVRILPHGEQVPTDDDGRFIINIPEGDRVTLFVMADPRYARKSYEKREVNVLLPELEEIRIELRQEQYREGEDPPPQGTLPEQQR